MEFVGALAGALIAPGATVPLFAVSTGLSVVRAVKSRKRSDESSISSPDEPSADLDSVTLTWRAVNCTRELSKGGEPPKVILENIAGAAKPGRVLAILGPSGSGKTTLLNALAGRIPAAKGLRLSGEVLVNGQLQMPKLAYVTQEDLFFSELSVEETLLFAARMRLPQDMQDAESREAFVDDLTRKLGLGVTKTTRVGTAGGGAGISGGERKRLSLGCELISTPKLIMCDEPTSGLDAFQAKRVMQTLSALAGAGHTVVISIHQPSSVCFEMCDDIILLTGGRLVYFGEREQAKSHFEQLGHPTPPFCNIAEHFLDLISIDYTSDDASTESTERIDKLIKAFSKISLKTGQPHVNSGAMVIGVAQPKQKAFAQFVALLRRAFQQASRDKKTNKSRFFSSFFSSVLFGAIYWKIGRTQSTIQDRLGLLQVCTINTAMTALVKTLNVFPKEATLVNRERVKGSYGVLPYFASKMVAELPLSAFFPLVFSSVVYPMAGLSGGLKRIGRFASIITLESFASASYGLVIGALVPNTEIAVALGPATFVIQIVFGGLYVTDKNVPKWASWIPRVSMVKHAFEALCVNELRGLKFEAEKPSDVTDGQQVLERLTWGDSTVSKSMQSLARIAAFNYLAAYTILHLKKPRFQQMVHPSAAQIEDVTDEGTANSSVEAAATNALSNGIAQEKNGHALNNPAANGSAPN